MHGPIEDRLAGFAGRDHGTWSLIAGGVAGVAGLVAGVLALVVAGAKPGATPAPAAVRLLVGGALTTAGVAVAGWYLLVERERTPSIPRAGACAALAGLAGLPVGWSPVVLWAGFRESGGVDPGTVAAVEGALSVSIPRLIGSSAVAIPLAVVGLVALVRIRRRVGEATDAEVRGRIGR